MNPATQELQQATEAFHLRLQTLLHCQGVFQVMQHTLPATPELFLEAQHALILAHTEFATTHQRLLVAHAACLQPNVFYQRWGDAPSSVSGIVPSTPEMRIPEPPPLRRQSRAGGIIGLTTPVRAAVRRELFPPHWDETPEQDTLECSEESEEDEASGDELLASIDRDRLMEAIDSHRFYHPDLVNAVDQEESA